MRAERGEADPVVVVLLEELDPVVVGARGEDVLGRVPLDSLDVLKLRQIFRQTLRLLGGKRSSDYT